MYRAGLGGGRPLRTGFEMCEGIILFQEVEGDRGVCAAEGQVAEDAVGIPPMQAIISISVSSSSSAKGLTDDDVKSACCSFVSWLDSDGSPSEGGGVRGESGNDSSNCASEGYLCCDSSPVCTRSLADRRTSFVRWFCV